MRWRVLRQNEVSRSTQILPNSSWSKPVLQRLNQNNSSCLREEGKEEVEHGRPFSLRAYIISTLCPQESQLLNLELWKGLFLETACPQVL